jgi:hypothetical protein
MTLRNIEVLLDCRKTLPRHLSLNNTVQAIIGEAAPAPAELKRKGNYVES